MEGFADASWCVQAVLVGMDGLALGGDSQPTVHLVHSSLGYFGRSLVVWELRSSENEWLCAPAQCIGLSFLLEGAQVIWAFRFHHQMLLLNPSAF